MRTLVVSLSLLLAASPAFAQDSGRCAVPAASPLAQSFALGLADPGVPADAVTAAERLVAEGRMAEAREALRSPAANAPSPRVAHGWALASLAAIAEGDPAASRDADTRAAALLGSGAASAQSAASWLVLGWARSEAGDVPSTRQAFASSAEAARRAAHAPLLAAALVQAALLEARIGADAGPAVRSARAVIATLSEPVARAQLGNLLALATLPESRGSRRGTAHAQAPDILVAAYADASEARDAQSLSHALGLLGEWQWLAGDARTAAATLARAEQAARAAPNDPWRFRWTWKLGLALRANGDKPEGAARLQDAVAQLEEAKSRRALGRFSASTLARDYRRAYVDLADALLADGTDLARVRATLELSRAAELEDYFRDPCLASRSTRVAEPQSLDPGAVLLHPVLFDDRIEILASHKSGIRRFTVAKDARTVTREVQRLRNAVERPGSLRYRESAGRLHAWLVAPLEAHLASVGAKTLVWVPDGALRGLPFAALHDGRTHLVERFAIAVTPVATLTDPRAFNESKMKTSLSGLTVASQGFSALPGVAEELDTLSKLLSVPALRDERFTVAALQASLRRDPVNAVHIASHGQFAPEAGETFLLAHDGRLTLAQLRAALSAGKVREEPLELLVLSACQTAAGDERAALGLAGVALGAGARSALATLWAVSDESTAALSGTFYRELLTGKAARAQALRTAQLSLLRDPRYDHPFYWAPYLLIGNWM